MTLLYALFFVWLLLRCIDCLCQCKISCTQCPSDQAPCRYQLIFNGYTDNLCTNCEDLNITVEVEFEEEAMRTGDTTTRCWWESAATVWNPTGHATCDASPELVAKLSLFDNGVTRFTHVKFGPDGTFDGTAEDLALFPVNTVACVPFDEATTTRNVAGVLCDDVAATCQILSLAD